MVFGGVAGAALARLFFFDFADGVVNHAPGTGEKGVGRIPQAFGLAEFAGEGRVDG